MKIYYKKSKTYRSSLGVKKKRLCMKKIVTLTAFIVLMGCSSDDWTPVAKNSNESYSSSSAIIESSSTLELSSSSVEPVIESSSEPVVESSSSVVTVSSSSVETVKSSSSTNCDEECQRVLNMTVEELCKYTQERYGCVEAIVRGCEMYLHDECWE